MSAVSHLFYSKAATLEFLSPQLKNAQILPFFYFSVSDWKLSREQIMNDFAQRNWSQQPLIIRSSSIDEDQLHASKAGVHLSLSNILWPDLPEAIEKVIASYQPNNDQNQILIQPFMKKPLISAVLFSYEPSTGAPYVVINFVKESKTSLVTSGTSKDARTLYVHRSKLSKISENFVKVSHLLNELERLYSDTALNIEFAIDQKGEIFLFQVRPLNCPIVDTETHQNFLCQLEKSLEKCFTPNQRLLGQSNILGVMPDWNPAEIIGIRPRSLARTLYQELVTDSIWALQRKNYGYRDVTMSPLMLEVSGCPYIDIRVSFNSFIPSELPDSLAEKLVNYYLDALKRAPEHHDKVEFEIVFSCYTPELGQKLKKLQNFGFVDSEVELLERTLHRLTQSLLRGCDALCHKELKQISELDSLLMQVQLGSLSPLDKVKSLMRDCQKYGTLPFAGLARLAFISFQLLQSLVHLNLLSNEQLQSFLQSLDTVASLIQEDHTSMKRSDFLRKYGYLRPGTYDVLSFRYDETPDLYFLSDPKAGNPSTSKRSIFTLPKLQLSKIDRLLEKHQFEINASQLFQFCKSTIEGREYAKFKFSKHISEILVQLELFVSDYSYDREDLSFMNIQLLQQLDSRQKNLSSKIKSVLNLGREQYKQACTLLLPSLLYNPDEIWQFELAPEAPNYITLKKARGKVVLEPIKAETLTDKIILLTSADPGYDWLFTHQISGLVTQFGGVNSHMAIRAGELGIPAVIGAGQVLFQQWKNARILSLDCANKQVLLL